MLRPFPRFQFLHCVPGLRRTWGARSLVPDALTILLHCFSCADSSAISSERPTADNPDPGLNALWVKSTVPASTRRLPGTTCGSFICGYSQQKHILHSKSQNGNISYNSHLLLATCILNWIYTTGETSYPKLIKHARLKSYENTGKTFFKLHCWFMLLEEFDPLHKVFLGSECEWGGV